MVVALSACRVVLLEQRSPGSAVAGGVSALRKGIASRGSCARGLVVRYVP